MRYPAPVHVADVLTAVAWCNLTTRSVFQRLYEKEERQV